MVRSQFGEQTVYETQVPSSDLLLLECRTSKPGKRGGDAALEQHVAEKSMIADQLARGASINANKHEYPGCSKKEIESREAWPRREIAHHEATNIHCCHECQSKPSDLSMPKQLRCIAFYIFPAAKRAVHRAHSLFLERHGETQQNISDCVPPVVQSRELFY